MKEKELKKILENHKHWLQKDCDRWEGMKADLSYADLSNADLKDADLSFANLSYANLSCAHLSNADLRHTNLSCARLSNADLSYADLKGANLKDAYLKGANLSDTDLRAANLNDADLSYAELSYADLRRADLSYVNLSDAGLRGAQLSDADLSYAKNVPYIPMVCPEEGDFIGWKTAGQKIIKLHIPEDALRSSATTRKCRCNKAKVIEIYNLDGTISEQRCVESDFDNSFIYHVGETAIADNFDKDRWKDCTSGIHFFINRQEAVEYDLS